MEVNGALHMGAKSAIHDCVDVRVRACMYVCTASLLDSSVLSVAACTALAEIGRRHALPLQDDSPSPNDQLTTDQCVPLTTAAVVEKLVNKVKSTSESAKV